MLVSGELPATASLPAAGELSVPAGSQLQWIGEILGGASSEDPALQYTKTTVGGSDVYRFTLTKSRTAQIEVPIADDQPFDGTTYTSALAWTATSAVPEVRLNVRVPQAAQIATAQVGAALQPGDAGYSFYTKTFTNVKAGDKLDLTAAYSIPAVGAAPKTATAASGSNSIVPIVLVIVVVGAFAGLAVGVRRKMVGASADDESAVRAAKASATKSVRSARADSSDAIAGANSRPGSSAGRTPMTGKAKRNLVTGVIVGVLIIAAVVMGLQNTRPQMSGDTISQTFGGGEPCATANISIAAPDRGDPRKTAETLFAAIKPITGLTTATYNVKTKSIEIGYCESKSSEVALRQALAPTGMVSENGAATAPVQ
jgi:hypothetical protein